MDRALSKRVVLIRADGAQRDPRMHQPGVLMNVFGRPSCLLVTVLCLMATACRQDPAPAPASAPRTEAVEPDPAPSEEPAFECPEGLGQDAVVARAVMRDGKERVVLTPDPGLGDAAPAWRGHLNTDGVEDLIVRFAEACGNYGECPFGVYVGCRAGRYVAVWGPDYTFDLKVREDPTANADAAWRDLIQVERTGQIGNERADERLLRFQGAEYQRFREAE